MGLAMSAMAFGADSDLIGKWSRPTQWADNNVVETITLAKDNTYRFDIRTPDGVVLAEQSGKWTVRSGMLTTSPQTCSITDMQGKLILDTSNCAEHSTPFAVQGNTLAVPVQNGSRSSERVYQRK